MIKSVMSESCNMSLTHMIDRFLKEEFFEYEGILGIQRRNQTDIVVFLDKCTPTERIRMREGIISVLRRAGYPDNVVEVQLQPGELVVRLQMATATSSVIMLESDTCQHTPHSPPLTWLTSPTQLQDPPDCSLEDRSP